MTPMLNQLSLFEAAQSFRDRDDDAHRLAGELFARLFADLTAPHPDYDALKKAYWDRVYRLYDRLPNHVDPRPRGNTERFVRHFRDWTG